MATLKPGEHFLHYGVDSILGQGGMGIVYKVFDLKLKRYAALKILQKNILDASDIGRFLQEVKAIASLDHKNIVKLYEVEERPIPYFTMEYVEGKTLSAFIKEEKCISEKIVAEIMLKVTSGLYHAHTRGIVHRDIKPANIMLTADLQPKLMDFGLARNLKGSGVSQSGVEGTPAYLAPEQLQNLKTDKRVDIYALGVTMYEALVGRLPFTETSYVSLFYQIINEAPTPLRQVNPNVSSDLEAICLKAMSKAPRSRYANSKYFNEDLQAFIDGSVVFARSQSLSMYRLQKIYQARYQVGTIFLLLLFPLFFVFNFLWSWGTTSFVRAEFKISHDDLSVFPKKGKLLLDWYSQQESIYANNIIQIYSERVWVEKNEKPQKVINEIVVRTDNFYTKFLGLSQYVQNNYANNKNFKENLLSFSSLPELRKPENSQIYQQWIAFLEIVYNNEKDKVYLGRVAEILQREYSHLIFIEVEKICQQLSISIEIAPIKDKKVLKKIKQYWEKMDKKSVSKLFDYDHLQLDKVLTERFSELIKFQFDFRHIQSFANFITSLKAIASKQAISYTYLNPWGYFYSALRIGDVWQKEKYLLKTLELQEEAIIYEKLAEFYEHMDMVNETIFCCQRGLEINPNNCLVHYYLAKTYIDKKEYKKAQKHLNFIEEFYPGSRIDLVYEQRMRIYLLKDKDFLTEKELKTLNVWLEENTSKQNSNDPNKEKEKPEIRQAKLWQKIYYEQKGLNNKAQSIINNKTETIYDKLYKMKVYQQTQQFSEVYKIHGDIQKHPEIGNEIADIIKTKTAAKDKKILTMLAELEFLDWQLGKPYVVELWLKTYHEIMTKIKENRVGDKTVWFRKLVYMMARGKGHVTTDKLALRHNGILNTVNTYQLPDDFLTSYGYYFSIADLADINGWHIGATAYYRKAVATFTPLITNYTPYLDKNLARYFHYDYAHDQKTIYENFRSKEKGRQVANNILLHKHNYGGACTLIGHHFNILGNHLEASEKFFRAAKLFNKAEFVFSQVQEETLSIREKKDFHCDFAGYLYKQEEYTKALQHYEKWQLYEPSHFFAWQYAAACLEKLGRYSEAIDYYNNLIKLDGEKDTSDKKIYNPKSYQKRAECYQNWAKNVIDTEKKHELLAKSLVDWEKAQPVGMDEFYDKENHIAQVLELQATIAKTKAIKLDLLAQALKRRQALFEELQKILSNVENKPRLKQKFSRYVQNVQQKIDEIEAKLRE